MITHVEFMEDVQFDTIPPFDVNTIDRLFNAHWLNYKAYMWGKSTILNIVYHMARKDQTIFYFNLAEDEDLSSLICTMYKKAEENLDLNLFNNHRLRVWDLDRHCNNISSADPHFMMIMEKIHSKQLECDVLIVSKNELDHDQEMLVEEITQKVPHKFMIEMLFKEI